MKRLTAGLAPVTLLMAALVVGACSDNPPAPPPAPPTPPSPPSPDLPMTAVKAREIIGDLPLSCIEMATLKFDMLVCEERQHKPADHEALRTELRDLRWTLQQQSRDAATAQCSAITNELRSHPKPQACWDLGIS